DDLFPDGSRGFWRNVAFTRMDEDALDAILSIARQLPGRGTGVDIHLLGGAFARVPEDATAFPNRTARFWMNIYGFWQQAGDDSALASSARHPRAGRGGPTEQGEFVPSRSRAHPGPSPDFPRHIYGEEKYRQLQRVKQQYDPANLFRSNYNVAPERLDGTWPCVARAVPRRAVEIGRASCRERV